MAGGVRQGHGGGTGSSRRRALLALLLAGLAFGIFAATGAAAAAAAGCGWNARCPYMQRTQLGGSDPAALSGPVGVALTPAGDEIVVDFGRQSIREFDPSGRLLSRIGSPGQFTYLHAVAVSPSSGLIYAEDGACVRQFNPDGTPAGPTFCGARPDPHWSQPVFLGVAAGPNGTIYVAEQPSAAHSSQAGERLDVYSAAGQLQASWPVLATTGANLAVDAQGDAFVIDIDAIEEYGPSGQPLARITTPAQPTALALTGSTLYVASGSGASAQVTPYDLTTDQPGSAIPVAGLGDVGPTTYPVTPELAAGPSGLVAVSAGVQIEGFGAGGTPTVTWGGVTPAAISPVGATSDSTGDVFAVDASPGRVRIVEFDAAGDPPSQVVDLTSSFPGGTGPATPTAAGFSVATDPSGNLVVAAGGTVVTVALSGRVLSTVTLSCQAGCGPIAVDGQGDLYASDHGHLDRFSPTGSLLATLPIAAQRIALDAQGDIYAALPGHVARYGPDGALQASWAAGGQFEPAEPYALALDGSGHVYATAQDGVHVYSADGQMLAVWPFSTYDARSGAAAHPGAIALGADGSVLVSGEADAPNAPASYVLRFAGLLDPLPPLPAAGASPWAQLIALQLSGAALRSSPVLGAGLSCVPPAPAIPTPAPTGLACAGRLTVSATVPAGRHTRTIVAGRGSFTIALGQRATVRIALSAAARRLLARTLRATFAISYRAGTRARSLTATFTLRRGSSR